MLGDDAREHVGARTDDDLDRPVGEILRQRETNLQDRQARAERRDRHCPAHRPPDPAHAFLLYVRTPGAISTKLRARRKPESDNMPDNVKPIRRVVTGNDANGRSRVLFDSAAPNVNPGAISKGTCMTDVWVYQSSPAVIAGARDDGNLPFHFEPPAAGGHLRIVQSPAKPANYDPAKDPNAVAP